MMKKVTDSMKILSGPVLIILVALLFSTILLGASGFPPFAIVQGFIQSLTGDLAGTIRWSTPLIISGLAVCITYRAGIFNLGVDGQLLMGAAAGTITALNVNTGVVFLDNILIYAAAIAAGAAYAAIPALLRIYLNSNEIVSTLLLNFVAVLFVDYLITGPFRDAASGSNLNATAPISAGFLLPKLTFLGPTVANISFFAALILVAIIAIVTFKMRIGREIRLVGSNPAFARFAGINEKKVTMIVFLISGALAGFLGVSEITGIHRRLISGFNPDFGMTGIVVALVGLNNPIGVLFSGLFFGALQNGGGNMERLTSVPSAVTEIIRAVIVLMLSTKFNFNQLSAWFSSIKKKRKANNLEVS